MEYQGVSVQLPDGLSEDQVLMFRPFTAWMATLSTSLELQKMNPKHPFYQSPYKINSINIQSYDLFGSRLGFLKAVASVTNSDGEHLPASVFLRGPSVAVLVLLVPDDAAQDSDERYAVLTVQPRIPAGSLAFVELPAGMVDDAGSFAGAAAKEMQEELGLEIHDDELTCLSELAHPYDENADADDTVLPNAMYPSAGGCDEHVTIYVHERRVPRSQLKEWSGKLTGLREHGEKITLKIVPMQNLWKEGARDAKCLAAVALWEGLKREGKL